MVLCLVLVSAAQSKRSAYDIPVGILPIGVQDYDLESSTGKFSAYFNKTCSFSLEGSYRLQYESTIKGVISKNKLTDLQSVKVKLWFVWVDIVEVNRNGDKLEFSVGIAGADFPIDNFEECPGCGCGMNCDTAALGRIMRISPFVSSTWLDELFGFFQELGSFLFHCD